MPSKGEMGHGDMSSTVMNQCWPRRLRSEKNYLHIYYLQFPHSSRYSSFVSHIALFLLWNTRETRWRSQTWYCYMIGHWRVAPYVALHRYQRTRAFVHATNLASQPLVQSGARLFAPLTSNEEKNYLNLLSNAFSIDIDYVSIAIHIVSVLSPSPRSYQHSLRLASFPCPPCNPFSSPPVLRSSLCLPVAEPLPAWLPACRRVLAYLPVCLPVTGPSPAWPPAGRRTLTCLTACPLPDPRLPDYRLPSPSCRYPFVPINPTFFHLVSASLCQAFGFPRPVP